MQDKRKILILLREINLAIQIMIMVVSAVIIIYYRYTHLDYNGDQTIMAIFKDPDLIPFWVTIELIIISGIIGKILDHILKKKYNIEEQ